MKPGKKLPVGATFAHSSGAFTGEIVAKDGDSYRYLIESIRRFPKMPDFARMIGDAGFKNVKYRPILGGAVAIHSGWKI